MALKSKIYEIMMMSYLAMGLSGASFPSESEYCAMSEEERLDFERKMREKHNEILLSKGCKEFVIDGHTIIALNKKNAQRKLKAILKSA
jgi:hypothetical protein